MWALGLAVFALLVIYALRDPVTETPLVTAMKTLAMGLFAVCVTAPAIFGDDRRTVRATLANPQIAFAGLVSYGIYLWHAPIGLWLVGTDLVATSFHLSIVLLAILLPVCIALGAGSCYWMERPLMSRVGSVKAAVA